MRDLKHSVRDALFGGGGVSFTFGGRFFTRANGTLSAFSTWLERVEGFGDVLVFLFHGKSQFWFDFLPRWLNCTGHVVTRISDRNGMARHELSQRVVPDFTHLFGVFVNL